MPFRLRATATRSWCRTIRPCVCAWRWPRTACRAAARWATRSSTRSSALGTTNFLANVNLRRALEGELARTITALADVRSARVHLVLPRHELFRRDQIEPSASITLRMHGAGRLSRRQVLAVQHLVAAAVPGLSPGADHAGRRPGHLARARRRRPRGRAAVPGGGAPRGLRGPPQADHRASPRTLARRRAGCMPRSVPSSISTRSP